MNPNVPKPRKTRRKLPQNIELRSFSQNKVGTHVPQRPHNLSFVLLTERGRKLVTSLKKMLQIRHNDKVNVFESGGNFFVSVSQPIELKKASHPTTRISGLAESPKERRIFIKVTNPQVIVEINRILGSRAGKNPRG